MNSSNTRALGIDTSSWYDDLVVIGKKTPAQVASVLRDMGDDEPARALEALNSGEAQTFGLSSWFNGREKAWQYTSHSFGYIPLASGGETLDIVNAGNVVADATLKNSRIKVTLDRLRGNRSRPGKQ